MSGPALYQVMPALDTDTEAALRASIEKYGVLVPIVVDHEGNVLDGHHRLKIANGLNPTAVRAGGPGTELSCPTCDKVVAEEEVSDVPRYECGDCGDSFSRDDSADGNSNHCPSCNKFAASARNGHALLRRVRGRTRVPSSPGLPRRDHGGGLRR